ncbi:MAG: FAD-dependent oxidoreductase [bacterium]
MGRDSRHEPIVILGAGVAGLATAYRLAELGRGPVLVLERAATAGGLAGTVEFGGARFDMGSHRVHPQSYPDALALMRRLLGNDLLRVRRHGRLRFNGGYLDYPPTLGDFLAVLGAREIARCGAALLAARLRAPSTVREAPSYENYLLPRVGRRAFDLFYAPYARKVFGLEPAQVSAAAAKTRITTARPWALVWQMARLARPRREPDGDGDAGAFFYYPRQGFGSIGAALRDAAVGRGVEIRTGVTVRGLRRSDSDVTEVIADAGGTSHTIRAAAVVSSLQLAGLLRLLDPAPPTAVRDAAESLRWRGIRLLQVVLDRPRCLDGETYYFPEERYVFGRISEPPLFSEALRGAPGTTALNIEVICSPGDALWSLDDDRFLDHVAQQAAELGLFVRGDVRAARSLRLPAVYPVYDRDYRARLDAVLTWLRGIDNLYSIGRGGLFLHANTDHSIHLGLRLAQHLAAPEASAATWDGAFPADEMTVRD